MTREHQVLKRISEEQERISKTDLTGIFGYSCVETLEALMRKNLIQVNTRFAGEPIHVSITDLGREQLIDWDNELRASRRVSRRAMAALIIAGLSLLVALAALLSETGLIALGPPVQAPSLSSPASTPPAHTPTSRPSSPASLSPTSTP